MNGFLRIYNIDDKATYEKPRNFYNWAFDMDMNPCPDPRLLPFWFDNIPATGGLTVSEFKLLEIDLNYDGYTTLNTYALTASDVDWNRGSNFDTFLYLGDVDQSTPLTDAETGRYIYYIKLSDDSEYISEPFWYLAANQISSDGDYNELDYDIRDYYI